MKAMDSINLDKWRELNLELFLAYLHCYNKLSKNLILDKKEQLAESINFIAPGKTDIEISAYASAYTLAREVGVFYEENGLIYLSENSKNCIQNITLNAENEFKNFLKQHAFNLELLINNKVVHPLKILVDHFNDISFSLEEATQIDDLIPESQKNNTSREHLSRFLKRLIYAGLLKKEGYEYQFINSQYIKDNCTFSGLDTELFKATFIGNNNYSNVVKLMFDRISQKINSFKGGEKKFSLNTIFYGPAGTGKTYTTIERAVEIIDGNVDSKDRLQITDRFKDLKDTSQILFVTFHQSFSYEEFIEGISVTTNNETKQTEYKIKDGVFKLIAKEAHNNPTKNYVLIIDEINRGNVSKIFGELITLLEPSKRLGNSEQLEVKLPYTQQSFGVPNNLYIIGTMNSSDRSLTALDVAMRRRFKFEELLPKPLLFKDIEINGVKIQPLLEAINERIEYLIGRDYCIGHAYFTSLLELETPTKNDLSEIFKNQILPLLQEYFYSDWEKIDLVLGSNSFIQKTELKGKSLDLFQDKSVVPEEVWSINSEAFEDAKNYIAIYKDVEPEIAKESVLA
ncbi:AAA family ATPase [Acinetobacter sp. 256-1]|uniref:McrB family protein n=1 Tax=Acinetobacter sp. 256-1 TaxID=2746721 RepID=UPI002578BAEA|nr:AAA family ATPase [Acinetobacter sp. 256-1]